MIQLVSAPEDFAVSLAEAKQHLRVEDDAQNTLIELYLQAATLAAENFLGRALVNQTWDFFTDGFPADGSGVAIPKPPLLEVLGVFYSYGGGAETEVPAASYRIDRSGPDNVLIPAELYGTWPTSTAVRIRFRAGYVDMSEPPVNRVPESIKAAILLTVGHLFANRESVVIGSTAVDMPRGAEWLLRPHRVALGMA